MNVYFGVINKEINSTKQLSTSNMTKFSCQLKDNVSVVSPVLKIDVDTWDVRYNYCYIPKWGRYYFLHDAVIRHGIWYIQCAIDVLATYKSYIKASTAYVRRSASSYDLDLPDPCWSHDTHQHGGGYTYDIGLASASDTYILFTASNDHIAYQSADPDDPETLVNLGHPSLSVYVVNSITLKSLVNYMFSQNFFESVVSSADDTTQQLAQTFFNPSQYIIKCMWVPFAYSDLIGNTTSTIGLGWFDYTVPTASGGRAKLLYTMGRTLTWSYTIGEYTSWIDRDPAWCSIECYVPGVGEFAISPEMYGKTLYFDYITDLNTGKSNLYIFTDANHTKLVQTVTGKLGCDVQLSSLYADYVNDLGSKEGLVRAGVGAAVGAVTTGAKALGKLVNTVGNLQIAAVTGDQGYASTVDLSGENVKDVAQAAVSGAAAMLQPTLSTIGINDAKSLISHNPLMILTIRKYEQYDDIHEKLGGMRNKIMSLANLSGYTEIVNPDIECPAMSNEITMINNFLSGGFYLE